MADYDLIIGRYNKDIERYNNIIEIYEKRYNDKKEECDKIKALPEGRQQSRQLTNCNTYLDTIKTELGRLKGELENIKLALFKAELEKEQAEFNKALPKKKSTSRRSSNSVAPAPEKEITLAPLRPPVSATSPKRLILDPQISILRSQILPSIKGRSAKIPSISPFSPSGPSGPKGLSRQKLSSSKSKRQPPLKKKTDEEILEYNNLKVAIIFYIDLRTQYFYLFIENIYNILLGIDKKIRENTVSPFNIINLNSINDIIARLSTSRYLGINGSVSKTHIYIEQYKGHTFDHLDEQGIIGNIKEQNKYIKEFLNIIKSLLNTKVLDQFKKFIGKDLINIIERIMNNEKYKIQPIIDDGNQNHFDLLGLNQNYEEFIDEYILFNNKFYNEQTGGATLKEWRHNIKEKIKNSWLGKKIDEQIAKMEENKAKAKAAKSAKSAKAKSPTSDINSKITKLLNQSNGLKELEETLKKRSDELEEKNKEILEGLEKELGGLEEFGELEDEIVDEIKAIGTFQEFENEFSDKFQDVIEELGLDIYNIRNYIDNDIQEFFTTFDIVFNYIDTVAVFLQYAYNRLNKNIYFINIKDHINLIDSEHLNYKERLDDLVSKSEYKLSIKILNPYKPIYIEYNRLFAPTGATRGTGGTLVKRRSPKKVAAKTAKAAVKKTAKEVVKKTANAAVKKTDKAVVKKTAKAVVKKTDKAAVKKTAKAVVKKTAKAVVKKTAKAAVKKTAKEVVKKTAKAVVKKTAKAVVKK